MKIEDVISQRTFKEPYLKADINLVYTSSQLAHYRHRLLKPHSLSIQQFNILRILRGMKGQSSSVKSIQQKMIDKMSNASRLIDKLYAKKLVTRITSPDDRRQVDILITDKGLELVAKASEALEEGLRLAYNQLTAEETQQLNLILDKIRIN